MSTKSTLTEKKLQSLHKHSSKLLMRCKYPEGNSVISVMSYFEDQKVKALGFEDTNDLNNILAPHRRGAQN